MLKKPTIIILALIFIVQSMGAPALAAGDFCPGTLRTRAIAGTGPQDLLKAEIKNQPVIPKQAESPDYGEFVLPHPGRNEKLLEMIRQGDVYRITGRGAVSQEQYQGKDLDSVAKKVSFRLRSILKKSKISIRGWLTKRAVSRRLARIRASGILETAASDLDLQEYPQALGLSVMGAKEQLVGLARNVDILVVKGRLTLHEAGPFAHARRSVSDRGSGIWLGEKLFFAKEISDKDIAALLLEECKHILGPALGHDVISHPGYLMAKLKQAAMRENERYASALCEADMGSEDQVWEGLKAKLGEKAIELNKVDARFNEFDNAEKVELFKTQRLIIRSAQAMIEARSEKPEVIDDILENVFYYAERQAFFSRLRMGLGAKERVKISRFTFRFAGDPAQYAPKWEFSDITGGGTLIWDIPENLRGKFSMAFSEEEVTQDTFPPLSEFYHEAATIAYQIEGDTLVIKEFPVKDLFRHRGIATYTFANFITQAMRKHRFQKIRFQYMALEADRFAEKMVRKRFLIGHPTDEGEYFTVGEKLGGPRINSELILRCSRELVEALDVDKSEDEAAEIIGKVMENMARAIGAKKASIYFPVLDNSGAIVRARDEKGFILQKWQAGYRLGLKGSSRINEEPFTGEKKLYELMITRQIDPLNIRDPKNGAPICEFKDGIWTIHDRELLYQELQGDPRYSDVISHDRERLAADKQQYPYDYNSIKYFCQGQGSRLHDLRCVYWIMGSSDDAGEELIESVMSQVRCVHDRLRMAAIVRPNIRHLQDEFIKLILNLQLTGNMHSCFFHAANKIFTAQSRHVRRLTEAEGAGLKKAFGEIVAFQKTRLLERGTSDRVSKIERFISQMQGDTVRREGISAQHGLSEPEAARFNVYNSMIMAETEEDIDRIAGSYYKKDDDYISHSAEIMRRFIRQKGSWESVLNVIKDARPEFEEKARGLERIPAVVEDYYQKLKDWQEENRDVMAIIEKMPKDKRSQALLEQWLSDNNISLSNEEKQKILFYFDIENTSDLLEHMVSAAHKFIRFEIKKERLDLRALIDEAVNIGMMQARAETRQSQVYVGAIKIEFPEQPITIETDPEIVRVFALAELVSNAIKYQRASGGEIIVRVSLNDAGNYVKISVHDSGHGIARQDRIKLFHANMRLDKTKDLVDGSGLGLYLGRELVRSIGGELALEKSQPGQGSVFSVYLPAGSSKSIWVSEKEHRGAEIIERFSRLSPLMDRLSSEVPEAVKLVESNKKAEILDVLGELKSEFERFQDNCLQGFQRRIQNLLPESYYYDMVQNAIGPAFMKLDALLAQTPFLQIPESVADARQALGQEAGFAQGPAVVAIAGAKKSLAEQQLEGGSEDDLARMFGELRAKLLRATQDINVGPEFDYQRHTEGWNYFNANIGRFWELQRRMGRSKVEKIVYEGAAVDVDYYKRIIGKDTKAHSIRKAIRLLKELITDSIKKKDKLIVIKIDGRPGAGKSELAKILEKTFAKTLVIELDQPEIEGRQLAPQEVPKEIDKLKRAYNPANPKYRIVILEGLYSTINYSDPDDIDILAKTDEVTLWRRILARKRENIPGGETSEFLKNKDYYEFIYRYGPRSTYSLRDSSKMIVVDTFVPREIVLNHLFDCLPVISDAIIDAFYQACEASQAAVTKDDLADRMAQLGVDGQTAQKTLSEEAILRVNEVKALLAEVNSIIEKNPKCEILSDKRDRVVNLILKRSMPADEKMSLLGDFGLGNVEAGLLKGLIDKYSSRRGDAAEYEVADMAPDLVIIPQLAQSRILLKRKDATQPQFQKELELLESISHIDLLAAWMAVNGIEPANQQDVSRYFIFDANESRDKMRQLDGARIGDCQIRVFASQEELERFASLHRQETMVLVTMDSRLSADGVVKAAYDAPTYNRLVNELLRELGTPAPQLDGLQKDVDNIKKQLDVIRFV